MTDPDTELARTTLNKVFGFIDASWSTDQIETMTQALRSVRQEEREKQIKIDAAIARYRDDIYGPSVAGYILSQSEHRVYEE